MPETVWFTACGKRTKHGPHGECAGNPAPPTVGMVEEVGPGVAEALNADVRRQLAWTENDPSRPVTGGSTQNPPEATAPNAPSSSLTDAGE